MELGAGVKVYVYVLIDPFTDAIRYVGVTRRSLETRLQDHIKGSNYASTHKDSWILSLKSKNSIPIIKELEVCTEYNWQEREQYYISLARNFGFKLCNHTAGGDAVWVESKIVYQYDLKGNFITEYIGIENAAKEVNVDSSNISRAANTDGINRTSGSYQWRYAEDVGYSKNCIGVPLLDTIRGKALYKYNCKGEFIAEYDNAVQAASVINGNACSIGGAANIKKPRYSRVTSSGYQWRYAEDVCYSKGSIGAVTQRKAHRVGKEVYQYDLEGNFILEYVSALGAARVLNCSGFVIRKAANSYSTSSGYQWRYAEDVCYSKASIGVVARKKCRDRILIYQYDLEGTFLAEYKGVDSAAVAVNCDSSNISRAANKNGKLNTLIGYQWRYAKDMGHVKDSISPIKRMQKNSKYIVYQYNLEGKFITEHKNVKEAADTLKVNVCTISSAAAKTKRQKTVKGSQVRYAEEVNFSKDTIVPVVPNKLGNKVVYQYDYKGVFLAEYFSCVEAGEVLGCHPSNIGRAANSINDSKKGCMESQWRYAINVNYSKSNIDPLNYFSCKRVYQFDIDGTFMAEYFSVREAAAIVGVKAGTMSRILQGKVANNHDGNIWKFASAVKYSKEPFTESCAGDL